MLSKKPFSKHMCFYLKTEVAHLKLRPVHGHTRTVIEPEPFQVLFDISSSDCICQCVVDGLKPTEQGIQ